MLDLEETRAHGHGDAHDDGLTHACDVIHSAVQSSIEEVVGCLLKGGQHEHRVLHLGNAKPGDSQHLSLQRWCSTSEHAHCQQVFQQHVSWHHTEKSDTLCMTSKEVMQVRLGVLVQSLGIALFGGGGRGVRREGWVARVR